MKERVLIHLARLAREWDAGRSPPEASQKGIARSASVRETHVSRTLAVLTAEGLLTIVKDHVPDSPRRVSLYRISPEGYRRASELLEGKGSEQVLRKDEGGGVDPVTVGDVLNGRGERQMFDAILDIHSELASTGFWSEGSRTGTPAGTSEPDGPATAGIAGGGDTLEEGSGIPDVPSDFIGREEELGRIAGFILEWKERGGSAVVVVSGPEGMGKKTLVSKTLHDGGVERGGIVWLGPGGRAQDPDGTAAPEGLGPGVLVLPDLHLYEYSPGDEEKGRGDALAALISRHTGNGGERSGDTPPPRLIIVTFETPVGAAGPDSPAHSRGLELLRETLMGPVDELVRSMGTPPGSGCAQEDVLFIDLPGLPGPLSRRLLEGRVPDRLTPLLADYCGGNPAALRRVRSQFKEGADDGTDDVGDDGDADDGLEPRDEALLRYLRAGER